MFGLGMGEIIIIAIVALLVLGPDKLPDAAKSLSKGIRDFRKHSRDLQRTIEDDEQIGGAIRDIKSALRGEDLYVPPHLSREAEDDDDDADGDDHSAARLTPGDADNSAAGGDGANPKDPSATDAEAEAVGAPGPATAKVASKVNTSNAASSAPQDDDDLPVIRPASGAVAHDPKDELTPTPATPSTADDAHG